MTPKWLELARKELGTKEWPGSSTNPVVANYYAEASGHKQPDDVPWCAAFVGAMLKRAGQKPSGLLNARSYLDWGIKLAKPIPGAVVVFPRGKSWQGHVAIVEQADGSGFTVIGGNQSDAVTRARHRNNERVLGFRWPLEASFKHALRGPVDIKFEIKKTKEAPMAEKSAAQIVDEARQVYSDLDSVMSASGARALAKKAVSLIFYLAKLHMDPAERKGIKFGPVGPVPKAKKKAPARKKK